MSAGGSGEHVNRFTIAGLALSIALMTVTQVRAGEFDGWCFPADTDVCVGEQRPLAGNRFITCESTCFMENPINVRDLDAILYDVRCISDHPLFRGTRRMLVMRYETFGGETRALALDARGPTELERCQ